MTEPIRLTKAGRLLLLMEWQASGKLDGLTLQKIAEMFPVPPNRSTILRDLRVVAQVNQIKAEMMSNGNP